MNSALSYYMQKPYIKEKDGIILDVNDYFLNLTQFSKEDLCGKNITEILDILFRWNHRINITNKQMKTVIFTKTFDARFVNIKKYIEFNNINLYVFSEVKNSRLDNKLIFVKNLINDNKLGIAIYTANDLKLINANQKYLDYMPKPFNSKEAVYGKCMNEFLPNLEKYGGKDVILSMLKNNKPTYFTEYQSQILDTDAYLNMTFTPVTEDGEIKYMMQVLEDVTERILSRNHVQQKNKELESIIESVDEIISIVDKNCHYIKHNDTYKKIFGELKNKSIGYSLKIGKYYDLAGNFLPLEDLCFHKLLNGEKVKGQKLKYVCNGNDYYFSFNAIPIFDSKGNFEMGVIVAHDITELIKSNKLITNQNKELEIIFDKIHDALAVIDKNGYYIKLNNFLNNYIRKHTNISTLSKIGDTMYNGKKYYSENGKELTLEEFPSQRVLNGEIVKEQRVVMAQKHNKVYLDFNGVPIFDENGNFQYGVILSHNVTHIIKNNERIKQEQALILKTEHEKLEAAQKTILMKDEFISLISHEFKTPLNVIFSAIQLMEYAYMNNIPDKPKNLIKSIKQNTYRQLRLVNNLLDITRLNSGRFKIHKKNIDIVLLTKEIAQSVKLYSHQKNIKLLFICSLISKNIATDDEKLERIILNLLSNAIKFTDDGGTVTITLDENKETNTIVLEVSDTGLGIPKDKQKIIFERFGQVDSNLSRRAEGTGIGLSLVKKLVDVLDGKIELESEPGIGSIFRITLPITEPIENEENEDFIGKENRITNALNVEFSDIYL